MKNIRLVVVAAAAVLFAVAFMIGKVSSVKAGSSEQKVSKVGDTHFWVMTDGSGVSCYFVDATRAISCVK